MEIALHFGMSLSYDRLLMSAFSVLFVQTFVKDSDPKKGVISSII